MIYQEFCTVRQVRRVAHESYNLRVHAPGIASRTLPGQFVNIRIGSGSDPLLRRPFSVYWVDGSDVEVLFNVVGKGTELLKNVRVGDELDFLGPLGVPFGVDGEFDLAVLVGGGLGVAPLPLTARALRGTRKKVATFLGARSDHFLVCEHLDETRVATDDGSRGYHGTVVDLFARESAEFKPSATKIFGCGPHPMLRALAAFAVKHNFPCEVSLEGPMACGVGICQGCPVELVEEERAYALMCKDGPVFDVRRIRI